MIGSLGQNLLLGLAMRFELTPRNEIVTVKDFGHSDYPLDEQTISKAGGCFGTCWDCKTNKSMVLGGVNLQKETPRSGPGRGVLG